jgi:hypothetical protein
MGFGTINGSVYNNGTIDVGYGGDPLGAITINGNYNQGTTGTLKLRLQAAMAGSYDSLTINGTATLAGNLVVVAAQGFNPAAGDQFTILSYRQVFGDFNRPYTLPALNPPRAWANAAPGNNSLILTVQ